MIYRRCLLAATSLLGLAAAQVHTDCNPLEETGCPANPAFGTDQTFHFNTTPSYELWETTAGFVDYDEENGASFTIAKQGDSPTIRTKFYIFFGRTEIWLKAAPGKGIISSMMWLSDDLDEVDWEFLGSNDTYASTNFFGKGRQDFKNGGWHKMPSTQDDFHNYTTVWTQEQIDWYIDGQHVRKLLATEANRTENYPQTPMRVSLGIWAGGDPSLPEGTRKWAGGTTDYDHGPYTMHMKKVQITDFSSGKEYTYGDKSGSWKSINVAAGNSTAFKALHRQPEKSLAQKWNELPPAAKIGIYAGAGSIGAILIGALTFYCCKQRRLGAKEAKLALEREKTERMELERFKRDGVDPDGFKEHGHEYDSRSMHKEGMVSNDAYNVPETTMSPLDERPWGGNGGSPMMRAPILPVRDGSQGPASPLMNSPSHSSFHSSRSSPGGNGFDFGLPSPTMGPTRTPSPGMMRSQTPGALYNGMPSPIAAPMRSGSAPPVSYQRMGSPGPQQQEYGMQRMQSPGPAAQNRSFTQPTYRGPSQGGNTWGGQ